jgi:hypothetical protein
MVEPYYRDEVVTLYLGDSRTIFPSVSDQCAVMVTDPPYGIEFVSNMHGVRYETARTADRTVSIVGDEDTSLRDDIIQMWDMKPALVFGTWKGHSAQTLGGHCRHAGVGIHVQVVCCVG